MQFLFVPIHKGKNFNMDEIVKPMNSTSAFHHNHDQLNTLSAFMEMKRTLVCS